MTLFDFRQLQTPISERLRGAWHDRRTSFDFDGMMSAYQQRAGANAPPPTFALPAGVALSQVDTFLGELGKPVGVKSYRPFHATGEDFLHNYLGMVGIPIDLRPAFPEDADTVLLTQSAAFDPKIVDKIERHLRKGKNAVITSGLLEALQGKGSSALPRSRTPAARRWCATSRQQLGRSCRFRIRFSSRRSATSRMIPGNWFPHWPARTAGRCCTMRTTAAVTSTCSRFRTTSRTSIGCLRPCSTPSSASSRRVCPFASTHRRTLRSSYTTTTPSSWNHLLDQPVDVQLVLKQQGDGLKDIQSNERLTGQLIPQGTGFRADPDGGKRRYSLTLEPHSFRVFRAGG